MNEIKPAGAARRRRSLRIPLVVPLVLTSVNPDHPFSENSETISVSKHGCLAKLNRPLDVGFPLRLDIQHTDRTATAHVIYSKPRGDRGGSYEIALELNKVENFWGLKLPPEYWAQNDTEPQRAPQPELPAPPPAAEPEPPPAVPAERNPRTVEIEEELRETARKVSAEFEESYRQTLGDLLVRLRADQEDKISSDWTRHQNRARRQSEEDQQRLKQQAADLEAKQRTLYNLQDQFRQKLEFATGAIEQKVHTLREDLLSGAQEELKNLVESLTEEIKSELTQAGRPSEDLQATLDEARKVRDYIESVVRLVPQTIEARAGEALAALTGESRQQLMAELSDQLDAQLDEQQEKLRTLTEGLREETREKLLTDFDREERQLLDRVYVRLEEIRVLENGLRQFTGQVRSELESKSEHLLSELAARLNDQFRQRSDEMESAFTQRTEQIHQRAAAAVTDRADETLDQLKIQLQGEFDRQREEIQESLREARDEGARLESLLDKMTERFDANLQARFEDALEQSLAGARTRVEASLTSTRQEFLAQTEEQLREMLEPLTDEAAAAAGDVRGLLQSVEDAKTAFEASSAAVLQDHEQTLESISLKEVHLRKYANDTVAEARGEIKGRVRQAVEMAQEPLDRVVQEAQTEFRGLAEQQAARLTSQAEGSTQRLRSVEADCHSSVEESLVNLRKELLESFQAQAEGIARASAAKLQGNISEALQILSRALGDKESKAS